MTSPPPPYPGGPSDFGNMPPYATGGYGYPPPAKGGSGMAIAALVLGIVSIVLSFTIWVGAIAGIVGLILGIVGISHAKRPGGSGRGVAIAGVVTSALGLAAVVGILIFFVSQYQACQDKIGHVPSKVELQKCIEDRYLPPR
ncbi:MAG: DUF4190 domain-containing protein [Actinobacteria bacterium]|nr:DUF4190 domain-containing protein [Actinomycetota bacterium]MBI3686475.1 DUF4190 domain-containing protein [Actinomycetota bacterium]